MADRTEQVRIDLEAKDNASRTIDDVADDVAKLEKADPTVTVDADTTDAATGIADVNDAVAKLSGKDVVIALRAQIDDLKAQAKEAERALGDVSDKADDTDRHLEKLGGEGGLKTRGNAIADLTGPLGDASGAASDFAGVFDGLSDIAGDVASRVGLSAAAMESAIGGIGIAVAGAAALWTVFSGNAAKAKERQKEVTAAVRDFNKALAEGDTAGAAATIVDNFKAAYDAAKQLGLNIDETTQIISGQKLSAEQLFDLIKDKGLTAYGSLTLELLHANEQWNNGNASLSEHDQRVRSVTDALRKNGDAAVDAGDKGKASFDKIKAASDVARGSVHLTELQIQAMKDELSDEQVILNFKQQMIDAQNAIKENGSLTEQQIIDVKNAIIDAGTTAGLTPIEIQSTINTITPTDVNTAFITAQNLINQHAALTMNAKIQAQIDTEALKRSFSRLGIVLPDGQPVGTAANIFNINMPVGSRGVDVQRQIAGSARRSGRRFGAPIVRAS